MYIYTYYNLRVDKIEAQRSASIHARIQTRGMLGSILKVIWLSQGEARRNALNIYASPYEIIYIYLISSF